MCNIWWSWGVLYVCFSIQWPMLIDCILFIPVYWMNMNVCFSARRQRRVLLVVRVRLLHQRREMSLFLRAGPSHSQRADGPSTSTIIQRAQLGYVSLSLTTRHKHQTLSLCKHQTLTTQTNIKHSHYTNIKHSHYTNIKHSHYTNSYVTPRI